MTNDVTYRKLNGEVGLRRPVPDFEWSWWREASVDERARVVLEGLVDALNRAHPTQSIRTDRVKRWMSWAERIEEVPR